MGEDRLSEKCETCRFYRPRKDIDYLGSCRRWPPNAIKTFAQSGNIDGVVTAFPQPRKDEWCGEWQPRP
jgi:hypothetical protein